MTAFERLINSGDYWKDREIFNDFRLADPSVDLSFGSCKRFLVRVLTRAVLDVCMYDSGNPNHDSAKSWLLGHVPEAPIAFRDLADLVDLDWMTEELFSVAQEEGVHRDQIRNMKRLLYNLGDNDS